jgi:hypothetical protein
MKQRQNSKLISLPAEIYVRIENRLASTGFNSVDDYVLFVLGVVEEFLLTLGDKLYSKRFDLDDDDQLKATVISVLEML